METRANHVLIGAFILAFFVSGLLFALWIGRSNQLYANYSYFDIVFKDVTGLTVASDVRFQGVRIGEVVSIRIDPNVSDRVTVKIKVEQRDDLKILDTTVASLDREGLTNPPFVQLANPARGERAGEMLPLIFDPLAEHPAIASREQGLNILFTDVSRLSRQASALLEDLRVLINEENRDVISSILANVDTITGTLAQNEEDIDRILANTADLTGEVTELSRAATVLARDVDAFLTGDLGEAVKQFDGTAAEFAVLAQDLSRIIRTNEPALNQFASQGLGQFALFVADARRLVVRLERVSRRLETDPSGFLFGGSTPVEVNRKQ